MEEKGEHERKEENITIGMASPAEGFRTLNINLSSKLFICSIFRSLFSFISFLLNKYTHLNIDLNRYQHNITHVIL